MITLVTSVLMVVRHDRPTSVVGGLHPRISAVEREQDKFKYAKRIAINVLFCAGFCIFLPSFCVFVDALFDYNLFERVGPIVTLGLLLSSATNAFIYGLRHRDIRQAMKRLRVKESQISEMPPSRAGSIAGLHFATAFRAPSRAASTDVGIISRTILVSRNESEDALQIPNILITDSEAEADYQRALETALHGVMSSQTHSNGGNKRQRLKARDNVQVRH
uniref:G-protein coupled receptors family 1 profile domain-containing protein n=1 Tax=Plectus sambesii TaxID=2011161 RepID=A0A914WVG1_9BILA